MKKLPNSIRKFLRREKASIRRKNSDAKEAEKKVIELMQKTMQEHKRKDGPQT